MIETFFLCDVTDVNEVKWWTVEQWVTSQLHVKCVSLIAILDCGWPSAAQRKGFPGTMKTKIQKKNQIRFPRTATSDWESCSREMAIADQELKTEPPYLLTLTQGVSIFQWGHPNVPLWVMEWWNMDFMKARTRCSGRCVAAATNSNPGSPLSSLPSES